MFKGKDIRMYSETHKKCPIMLSDDLSEGIKGAGVEGKGWASGMKGIKIKD